MRLLLVALVALAACGAAAAAGDAERGRALFRTQCSTCHGLDAKGVHDRGPSLEGVGAASADFYLSTGRMPLDQPGRQPIRSDPAFGRGQIDDLVAYIASLGPGPPIPRVDTAEGDVALGQRLFADRCAGCHQIVGRGGVVQDAFAPSLRDATPTQVAEAVRVGPYVMPAFTRAQIDDAQLASLVRYVERTQHPDDRGGWGIFEIGPVPEGMVTWLLAGALLLGVIRLLGERADE
ncbi:MAG TPA: c-type cytochrome [Gaiellaceae bacterium]|jgi:ubiquinol-cytochrome c reductase cytochrome c subunit|nr:c-type cytochrome [Gaiellaceae bacterium]